MRFIAIDLEMDQPNNNQVSDSQTDVPKLIQVGIVVFELGSPEITVLESKTIHVHYDKPISTFIKTLTSITDEDVNNSDISARKVLSIISDLRGSYDTSRQIVEWGSGDTKFLAQEAGSDENDLHDMYGLARSAINVKVLYQVYAMMNGIKPKSGLSKSMGKMGLGFKCTHWNGKNKGVHWAESDALNTAILFNHLCQLIKKPV